MSLKEDILKESIEVAIEDLYSVEDTLDEYLTDTHKSKVHIAKAIKKAKKSLKVFENEIRNYKRLGGTNENRQR